MLLTIYDSYGQNRTKVNADDNSTQAKEIQADNVLSLSFTLYEFVALDVNDYVDFNGERYWLVEKYHPIQKSSVEWVYDLKLYGIESLIKRFLVLKTVDGVDEPVFTLTAPPREHLALIVQAINDGMGGITDYKVGAVTGTENVVMDYEGTYCDEALKQLAEKVGTEWWMEGQTLNLSRCEYGAEITLGYNKGLVGGIEKDMADNAKFYTRLFPIGSNKNIDREVYGHSRLQLPSRERYVDVNTDKYGIIHHYEADAFADIYPRRVGTVSSWRSETRTDKDGKSYKIYYFKDSTLNFNPNDYEIGGLVKRVSFQEGSELAGLGNEEDGTYFFEVNYNKDTKEFEIITIWPYDDDMQLPNDTLHPGGEYILWNISMPYEYYALAEEEFLAAVEAYNVEHGRDVARYKGSTDHVYVEENAVDLYLGRRVRLESKEYFPETGYRSSRITKITRKVNHPEQMDIEMSDALSTGAMAKIGSEITDVRNYAKSIAGSISLPDIIRSWDNTLPTDNNLFSARRTLSEFVSKTRDERVKGNITFEQNIGVGGNSSVRGNHTVGGDHSVGGDSSVKGNQTVGGDQSVTGNSNLKGDVIFGDHLESGDMIQGAKVTKEGHASFASVKSPYMEIFELLLNKQTAVGGEFKISDVGTIEEVTYLFGQEAPYTEVEFADYNREVHGRPWGAMLHLREEYEGYLTTFRHDDIVYGYVNGIGKSGSYSVYGQFFGVVKQVVDSRTLRVNIYDDMQVPAGSNLLPVPHMVITQRGNETDTSRQSVITLSSPDKNMVILHGVDSPVLAADGSCYGVSLGRLPESLYRYVVKAYPHLTADDMSMYAKNLIVQNLMLMDHLGQPIKTERYRGVWSESVAKGKVPDKDTYRLTETTYDTVTHGGSKWQCQLDGTTEAPSERSTAWSLIVAKGDTGDKGESGAGISREIFEYGVSDDFTTEPSWSEIEPANIGQGKVLWVKRTTEYTKDLDKNVTITKTYQGLDNTSKQYELRANVNIIYIHDRESASKQSIRITVGKTTSEGYTEITDSDTLREEGFIVQYNYDSRGERKTLSFANTAMLLEGDDDTLLVGEDDSEMVYEFTVADITSIEDHIMFYLAEVDSAGNVIQDWATREVDVVRDGDGALTIDLNEDSIILTTSVDAEPYTIISDGKTYTLYPKVKIGGVEQSLSALIDAGNVSVVDSNSKTYTFRRKESVSFNPNIDAYKENGVIVESLVPTWIDFTVNTTNSKGETMTATKRINIIRNYRGLPGKTGAQYFAQGFFSEQAAKAHLYICNERNIGFVLDAEVKDSQNGGHYEYTGKPFRYSNNGIIYSETELNDEEKNTYKMLTPHEDYALGGDYAWNYMPKYEVVLANFIMANNARFGHLTRGGVFYDRYLFSAYGTSKEGVNAPYDTYVEDMFDGNDADGYILNGNFTPKLFLDFFGGAAKFGKISEPFTYMKVNEFVHVINPDEGHNLSVRSKFAVDEVYNPSLVILPKVSDNDIYYDGLRCSIIAEGIANKDIKSGDTWPNIGQKLVIVSADNDIVKSDFVECKQDEGLFCVGGRFVKFIAMEPGSMLHLRCCMSSLSKDTSRAIWYVENASDFEPIRMEMTVYGASSSASTIVCEHEGWYQQGTFMAMGTKYVNSVRGGSETSMSFTFHNQEYFSDSTSFQTNN